MTLALLAALTAPAAAQDEPPELSVGARYRRMFLPSGLLDAGWFDSDDEGALPYDRPRISAHLAGLELTVRPDPASFIFYAEYIAVQMPDGYWDDREDPPDHLDGDWLEAEGLGVFAIGANLAHEVALTDSSQDTWLGLTFGGGVGLGVSKGTIRQWHPGWHEASADPDCRPDDVAPDRLECAVDEESGLWPVVPIVDLTVGPRLHIAQRAFVRIDAGLHDMLYLGGAAGGVF